MMQNSKKANDFNHSFASVPTKEEGTSDEADDDTQCGIGTCKPRWLQPLADPKAYLINFCILGVLQGAYFTYFIGIITTLEKRFAFESKVSGIIMIADNLSPIIISILVGYFGGQGHRPRWIAGGMMAVIISCFLSATPYFIYGTASHLLEKKEMLERPKHQFCDLEGKEGDCDITELSATIPAVSIFFIASFINGFGYTAFYTVGTPYLDDNVKKKNSPLYFSAMFALRILGPSLGFMLASFTLKYYENPFYDPGFTRQDPRWIGAWWMGFIILGVLLLVASIPMFLFPRRLPGAPPSPPKRQDSSPKLKDFPKAVMKLAKNPLLVCITVGATLQINGFLGYFVFMPKYMESQYRQSASSASLFSGTTSIIAMVLGIILGGVVIRKFKPRPKYLTAYMVFVDIFSILGLTASMFFGCPAPNINGRVTSSGQLDLYNACNEDCGCTRRVFEPLCGADNETTFFSPCFAGCTGFLNHSNPTVFLNCSCAYNSTEELFREDIVGGYCPLDCNMFLPYIIVLSVSKFISSTARVGSTLVTLRCVDPNDKSFALGAIGTVFSAFAFIPYPLVFGALTDAACIVWEESCGKTGNCWLYDTEKFRYYLHGMSLALIAAGTVFQFIIFLLSGMLKNFYEDEEKESGDLEETVYIRTLRNPEDKSAHDMASSI